MTRLNETNDPDDPGHDTHHDVLAVTHNRWLDGSDNDLTPSDFEQVTRVVSSDDSLPRRQFVGATDPAVAGLLPIDGDLWDDTLCFTERWLGGAWPAHTLNPVSYGTSPPTLARNVAHATSPAELNNIAGGLGQVICSVASTDDNPRYLVSFDAVPNIIDSEVTSLWYFNTGSGSGQQQGHFHRLINIGDNANQNAYVVWENVTPIIVPGTLVMGGWKGRSISGVGTFTPDLSLGSGAMEGVRRTLKIINASRAGNVTTLTCDAPLVGFHVGDYLTIGIASPPVGVGSYKAITSMTDRSFTYVDPGADVGSTTVVGYAQNISRVYPMWVSTRVVGNVLAAKAWCIDQPEPSWSEPAFARIGPADTTPIGPGATLAGKCGLVVAHCGNLNDQVQYGPVRIRRAVYGRKMRVGSTWVAMDAMGGL